MNVWDLFLMLTQTAIDWMKETTIFYGISAWTLTLLAIAIFLAVIILDTIFNHKGDETE
jgi:hypothetical protein